MLSSNQNTHLSKLLSYILRHKPSAYEIVLDENGYTNVNELINKLNAHNENISFEILQQILKTTQIKWLFRIGITNIFCFITSCQTTI